RLYAHQQEAMESFIQHNQDLIVATGTGSGKTETFMYPILNTLYLEEIERPEQFAKRAVRALILYPMNALVSDEMARLRRLCRDERLSELFREAGGRKIQLRMYTPADSVPASPTKYKTERLNKIIQEHLDLQETPPDIANKMKEK